jgi:hypothetical protein
VGFRGDPKSYQMQEYKPKSINDLLETSCQLCTDMELYETDDNGGLVNTEKDDEFPPIK